MNKIITYDNLRSFAYSNDKICTKPIKGIVLSFFGLGGADMYFEDTEAGKYYAEKGIIYVVPYTNPWAWMNKQAVQYTDEIIDVLFDEYKLGDSTKIASTGGSMGGLSALVYTVYSKRTPAVCTVNCPVCDLPYHYTERDDLPRTLYSAFYNEQGDISTVLQSASPLHLVNRMPEIKYHIFHCEKDSAVNISKHSEVFLAEMKKNGFDITFDVVPERDHCDLTDEMRKLYQEYVVQAINA